MKKILTLVALVLSLGMSAQKIPNAHQRERMSNFTSEQQATIKSKQMALHLDLNKQQQKQVYSLILKQKKDVEKLRKKRREAFIEDTRPTKEQQFNRLNKGLDAKLAFQNKLKNILNDKQYAQWKIEAGKRAQLKHRKMAFNDKRKRGFNKPQRNRF
jgi:periplasmic protein CpxP/Spy